MDPTMAGLMAGGGSLLGAIGGFLESRSRRKALERFRRRQMIAIDESRQLTEQRVDALLNNPLIAAATDFIQGSFSEGGTDPLATNLAKGLRVAQEARGLRRSTAGAVAEASSLAAFRQNFLAQLLPQAQSFGTLGERFRQSIFAQEVPINVARLTGAPVPGMQFTPDVGGGFDPLAAAFGGGTAGGLAGFQVSQQLSAASRQNDILSELQRLRRGPGDSMPSDFGGMIF